MTVTALDASGRRAGEAELALPLDGGGGGGVAVPVCAADPAALAEAYTRAARRGGCPLLLSPLLGQEQRARVAREAVGVLPEAGHLLCTSGTTGAGGAPRVYFFAREAALGNARAHVASLGMRAGTGERVLLPMSLSHGFGLVAAGLGCAELGAPLFAFAATPDPGTLLAAVAEHEVTTVYLSPPLARLLLRHLRRRPVELPSLRRVSVGSGPMARVELEELALRLHVEVCFTYGATELGPRVSTLRLSAPHDKYPPTPTTAEGLAAGSLAAGSLAAGSLDAAAQGSAAAGPAWPAIGAPIEGVSLEVRDGELHVRSPYAARGRWRDGIIHPIAGEDGFVATCDAARVGAGGIELGGRLDGVIVMGGGNVYPEDVEGVADRVAGVAASCVVGRPSPLYGEVPVLVCELEAGADAGAVARALSTAFAAALPAAHAPVDTLFRALPRTAAGKVARGVVRAALREAT